MQVARRHADEDLQASRSRGATWLPDDTIVFAPSPDSGLMRVPAAGGEPKPLTELDAAKGEATHRWPQALPDGKHVLFTSHTPQAASTPPPSRWSRSTPGSARWCTRAAATARYVPTGHLVFVNRGTLFARPVRPRLARDHRRPVPVLQEIATSVGEGGAQFDFSANGLLAYVAGSAQAADYPILWVDRHGRASRSARRARVYANPQLSPDGTRLSLTVLRDDNWDVWVYDLERGVSTRLTFDKSSRASRSGRPTASG